MRKHKHTHAFASMLMQVCKLKAKQLYRLDLATGLEEQLDKHIKDFHSFDIADGNARLAVNLVEKAVNKQTDRLGAAWAVEQECRAKGMSPRMRTNELHPNELAAEDFGISQEPKMGDLDLRHKIKEEADGMIGMPEAKAFFGEIEKIVQYVEHGGNPQILRISLNMVCAHDCMSACMLSAQQPGVFATDRHRKPWHGQDNNCAADCTVSECIRSSAACQLH